MIETLHYGVSNLDRVGHRRWQLNPFMGKIGFGYSLDYEKNNYPYTAEKVIESDHGNLTNYEVLDFDYISWPSSGNFPKELLNGDNAWSITLNASKYASPERQDIKVVLKRESDGKQWTFDGAKEYTASDKGDYFNVELSNYGIPNCIIFRPDGITEYTGKYTVSVEGLRTWNGDPVSLSFETDFFNAVPAFTDVNERDYYYRPIVWALNSDPQITNGTTDTTFSPSQPCTRGQAVTFLWRASGSPKVTGVKNPFNDVKTTDYYYDAVLWAYQNGITQGISDDQFGPKEKCTRAQIVTFLWRAQGKPDASTAVTFKDIVSSAYYYQSVQWAVEKAVTNGTTATTFDPSMICTRGQIVTFLYRALV